MARGTTLLLFFTLAVVGQTVTPSSFLSTVDKARLKQVLATAWELKDLPTVHYSILGYKLLGETIPNAVEACKFLQSKLEGGSIETYYHVYSAGQALGDCKINPGNAAQILSAAITDDASVSELYYATQALRSLSLPVEKTKVIKALQLALRRDDSLINLGYTFHIASQLDGDVAAFYERIEDAVVQADEVDNKLQFEGGLSITALIVSGVYKLAEAINKSPTVTAVQAVKFSNYFMSRKSVQLPKGAYYLLDVVNILTKNKYHIPVAVTLASNTAVSKLEPLVQVQVTDLMGQSLGVLNVIADSATRVGDEVVVMSKKKFTSVEGESSLYELNVMETNPGRGFYQLAVSAYPSQPDKRLVGNEGAIVQIKVLTSVSVEGVEVGTADLDQSIAPKLTKVSYPNKLTTLLEADHHQKLIMKFTLKDGNSEETMAVHQAFVGLTKQATNQEIIFVAEPDSSNSYKFDMDVNAKAKDFGHQSGKYNIDLIIGDAVVSNPFIWNVASVKLKFPEAAVQASVAGNTLKAKPEIKHIFREPEKSPPELVSNTFTVLVFVPLIILFLLWGKLGVNISNFPLSVGAIGFHTGLGVIFILFGVFWLKLNMFTTLKYLMGTGIVTFLCGNSMLAKLAANRSQ